MTVSTFRHNPEGKDRFFTVRHRKYLVVEMPASGNYVDIYVGILRNDRDYRFNEERNLSNLKAMKSAKERENVRKVISQNFYSEHRKDNLMINQFNFIGCKKSSKEPSPSYSSSSNFVPDWNEELV